MFICVNNLIQTELNVEEVLLLPEPLHYKSLNSNLLKISDRSSILTNLPKEDLSIIDQFQEQLKEFGFKEKLSVNYDLEYSQAPNENSILELCEGYFPKLEIKHSHVIVCKTSSNKC